MWHTLRPVPRPHVESFEIRYEFPGYANLPRDVVKSDEGDLEALVGTTAEVTVRFDQAVRDPVVRFGTDGVEAAMAAAEDASSPGRVFTTSIPIVTAGYYQIDATSLASGISNPFAPRYAITPLVDSPPRAHWGNAVEHSSLVASLEIVPLAAWAEDDVPMDRLLQEYRVNRGPWRQRILPVESPSRELSVRFDWDLLHLGGPRSPESPLAGGDLVETRFVAVDRRGNRGSSRIVELLVAGEGFDSKRHDRLHQNRELAADLLDWLTRSRAATDELLTAMTPVADGTAADERPDVGRSAEVLRQSVDELGSGAESVMQRLETLLRGAASPTEANLIELVGRAIAAQRRDLEFGVRERQRQAKTPEAGPRAVQREEPGSISHREWTRRLKDSGRRAELTEELVRAHAAHRLTRGVFRDATALRASLLPIVAEDSRVPVGRIGRHVDVALGRLSEIDALIEQHSEVIPESTNQQLSNWFRFSHRWATRLEDLVEAEDARGGRSIVVEFHDELARKTRGALNDGRLGNTLARAPKDLAQQLGTIADDLHALKRIGEQRLRTGERRASADDSVQAGSLADEEQRLSSLWSDLLEITERKLELRQALHRQRPDVDLEFTADLRLLARALDNVSADGYASYRQESPGDVFENLAGAILLLEARHDGASFLDELRALIAGERYLRDLAGASVDHPMWVERYQVGLELASRRLREAGVDGETVQTIDQIRYNDAFNEARQRITSRRWQDGPPVPGDQLLGANEDRFQRAMERIAPLARQARATIRRYVLNLVEQANRAAELAEAARDRTRTRADDAAETAQRLSRQQRRAEEAADETVERLVDRANNVDPLDDSQRGLARDADAAIAKIQQSLQAAQDSRIGADAAADKATRREALEESAGALDELAGALKQTAEHFAEADAGGDIAESREQLRQALSDSDLGETLRDAARQAERLAETAARDPRELLRRLEEELERNEPMRDELDDIASRVAELSLRKLEQAARDERTLNQSIENSDDVFQERKRLVRERLRDLTTRVEAIEQGLLEPLEKAIDWGDDPTARPTVERAQRRLRDAVRQVQQLGGDETLLPELGGAISELAEAVNESTQLARQLRERSGERVEENIHGDQERRNRSAQELMHAAADSRRRLSQAASRRQRDWSRAESQAKRRLRVAMRQQQKAERRVRETTRTLDENPGDEAARRRLEQAQREVDTHTRTAELTRETRDFTREAREAADQRGRELSNENLEPLKAPNPAAELAQRLSGKSEAQLRQLADSLKALAAEAAIGDTLRIPPQRADAFREEQERITAELGRVAEDLDRAGRHEDRLGRGDAARRLTEAAQAVGAKARTPAADAADAIRTTQQTPTASPRASQAIAGATEGIAGQAEALARWLETQQAAESDIEQPSPDDTPSAPRAGRRLAQTLDELDQSVFGSKPGRGADPPADGGQRDPTAQANASGEEPSAGESGQDSGDTSAAASDTGRDAGGERRSPRPAGTSLEASSTLASALENRRQASARQRELRGESASSGEDAGEATDAPGPGDVAAGPARLLEPIDRDGAAAWGRLRERRTEDAVESGTGGITPEYRREIEAYFRAVARRASEKQAD